MVASNFQKSLQLVLTEEGGNDDDPADHGGRTSRGITQREYDAWCKEQGLVTMDVWQATQKQIDQIYYQEYWLPVCDLLPSGVDYMYFDMAVNAGPYRAAVLLQRALGVTADGRIGPMTRQSISTADPRWLIDRFTVLKKEFYTNLHQPKFLRGWLNRANFVQNAALAMIGATA